MTENRWVLALFLLFTVGGGLAIGFMTAPDEWYQALVKPSFNPPAWLFGPVWTVLYFMIAFAGWLIWKAEPSGLAMKLWTVQILLNFAWSPTFFTAHRTDLALLVIIALLAIIVTLIVASWRRHRLAAWLLVPYGLWVAFASFLNASIWQIN